MREEGHNWDVAVRRPDEPAPRYVLRAQQCLRMHQLNFNGISSQKTGLTRYSQELRMEFPR